MGERERGRSSHRRSRSPLPSDRSRIAIHEHPRPYGSRSRTYPWRCDRSRAQVVHKALEGVVVVTDDANLLQHLITEDEGEILCESDLDDPARFDADLSSLVNARSWYGVAGLTAPRLSNSLKLPSRS